MTPLEILDRLEGAGYKLRVKDGQLRGPRGLSDEWKALISENKDSLIALITYQCPRCNQVVRENFNTPYGIYIECVSDPVHFSLHIPKKRGQPSFVSCGGIKPENCQECGSPNDGEWKYCGKCWLKFIEEDMEPKSAA